jgi:hypothetical protein
VKKLITLLWICLIHLSLTPPISANSIDGIDFKYNGIIYTTLTDSTCETKQGLAYKYENRLIKTSGNDVEGDIIIPEVVYAENGKRFTVTQIAMQSFYNNTGLTSITIANTVTRIQDSAFEGCTGLTSISLPGSLTEICSKSFDNCNTLTSISIPSSVKSIGASAFYLCNGLSEVNISDLTAWCGISFGDYSSNPLTYAHRLFLNDHEITELTIPEYISAIGDFAFYNCTELTSLTIPNSVTEIGASAFSGCKNLTTAKLSSSLTKIGDSAFGSCVAMNNVEFPESLSYIGIGAFGSCIALTELNLPQEMECIAKWAFAECMNVSKVSLPKKIKCIGESAFYSPALKHVVLPEGVDTIYQSAFSELDYIIDNSNAILYKRVSGGTYTETNSYTDIFGSNTKIYTSKRNNRKAESVVTYFEDLITPNITQCSLGRMSFRIDNVDENVTDISVYDPNGNLCQKNTDGYYIISTVCTKEHDPYLVNQATITAKLFDEPISFVYVPDIDIADAIDISVSDRTQTTCTFKIAIGTANGCKIKSIQCDGKTLSNNSLDKVTGLRPDADFTRIYTIETNCGTFTKEVKYSTLPVSFRLRATEIGPSSIKYVASWTSGDAEFEYYYQFEKTRQDLKKPEFVIEGLDPNTTYSVEFWATEKASGGMFREKANTRTSALEWGTNTATPTSVTSCRIMSATNCNANTGTGFEWKRYDAPDEMAGNKVSCPVVDGILVGSLRNLNSEAYYKYRPFYTSDSGKTYYGGWTVFFTGDANVYFDPDVRTLEDIDAMSHSAVLKGYVLPGSDDIQSQGFQYRKVSGNASVAALSAADGNWISVDADGVKPTATIEGLESGTEYEYRVFATTNDKTFYSDSRYFTTEFESGIDEVSIDAATDSFTLDVRNGGELEIAICGAAAGEAAYELYNISGACVGRGRVDADGSYHCIADGLTNGLYVIVAHDGRNTASRKIVIR